MTHEVFICHSAKDKSSADMVCAGLEAAGIKCWIAPRDVRAGVVWAEAITEAIDTSKVMVVLISSDTIRSQHQVIREIELADNRNTALLPLFIENVTLSKAMEFYLRNRQWIDASTPPLESHMPKLVRAIRELLTGETQPHPPPDPKPPPPKSKVWRWAIVGGAALVIVASAIITYNCDFFPSGDNRVLNDNKSPATPGPTSTPVATLSPSPRSTDDKPPPTPTATSTPTATTTLAAPETLRPQCRTRYAWSEPTLQFAWSPVEGASTYTLEVDCFGCRSQPSGWSSQLGRPWFLKEGLGLRSPIYTNQDVYARLRRERARAFRWRVWAVDSNLVNGQKSSWCQLAFAGASVE